MSTATNHIVKAAKLAKELLVGAYRMVYMSRRVDDKEIQLKRQNRAFFQISGVGHETISLATALHLKPGYDWFYPYYRDRALCLQLGVTAYEMFLGSVGAKDDPASAGRLTQLSQLRGLKNGKWFVFSDGLSKVGTTFSVSVAPSVPAAPGP